MLVAAGLATLEQIEEALSRQVETGRRLGEELVALGAITEAHLTQILSNQLSVPWVSLYHVEFSRELLNLIPAGVAAEYCLIPVYVRQVRGGEPTLFVAMNDPSNRQAVEAVAAASGLPVKAMVAPPSEIRHAISVYYYGIQPSEPTAPETARRSSPPPAPRNGQDGVPPKRPPPDSGAPRQNPSGSEPGGVVDQEASPAPSKPASTRAAALPSSRPPPASRPSSDAGPSPAAGSSPRSPADKAGAGLESANPKSASPSRTPLGRSSMLTLTLLDGTVIKLPASGSSAGSTGSAKAQVTLTATDLVHALMARAQGKDVSGVLNDDLETLFATLLSLLLRKGVIADWEFVEEWKRRRRGGSGTP